MLTNIYIAFHWQPLFLILLASSLDHPNNSRGRAGLALVSILAPVPILVEPTEIGLELQCIEIRAIDKQGGFAIFDAPFDGPKIVLWAFVGFIRQAGECEC